VNLKDSGGDTSQFTVTVTDGGDLNSDSVECRVSATSPTGNSSINVEAIGTNYLGIREAWRQ